MLGWGAAGARNRMKTITRILKKLRLGRGLNAWQSEYGKAKTFNSWVTFKVGLYSLHPSSIDLIVNFEHVEFIPSMVLHF